jgi:hypothetical protein
VEIWDSLSWSRDLNVILTIAGQLNLMVKYGSFHGILDGLLLPWIHAKWGMGVFHVLKSSDQITCPVLQGGQLLSNVDTWQLQPVASQVFLRSSLNISCGSHRFPLNSTRERDFPKSIRKAKYDRLEWNSLSSIWKGFTFILCDLWGLLESVTFYKALTSEISTSFFTSKPKW